MQKLYNLRRSEITLLVTRFAKSKQGVLYNEKMSLEARQGIIEKDTIKIVELIIKITEAITANEIHALMEDYYP